MNSATITKQDAIDKVVQAFDHDVQKFPVSGPDNMQTGYHGLFDKNGKVVGTRSVTDDYYVHTCDDIVELATAAINTFNGVADVKCSFNHGHRLIIEPPEDVRKAVYGTQDNIFGRLVINAPYVSGAVDATFGLWRDMCSNLAMLRMLEGTTTKIRHTKSLDWKMDNLKAEFANLSNGWNEISDAVDTMEDNRVILKDFLDSVYGGLKADADARAIKAHEKRTELITLRLLKEHQQAGRPAIGSNFEVSGWQAFNAVQGHQQHKSIKRGNPTADDRIWKSFDDKLIRKAERLALVGV
jgi:hypothetical protein